MTREHRGITLVEVEDKIIELDGVSVILDRDVAALYGVETKRVNEAVSNNPDKFPAGYVLEIADSLRSKFSTLENDKVSGRGKYSKHPTKAFTEKGLYMLATVLKSQRATQTTIGIIETFSKVRELAGHVRRLQENPPQNEQKTLMQASGEIIAELIDPHLDVSDTETSIEINFALLKFKHTVKKRSKV
ncbi:MAG: ORF6N domain-containing protein [Thermoguttaceae bacterium]